MLSNLASITDTFFFLHGGGHYLFLYTSYSQGLIKVQVDKGGVSGHFSLKYKIITLDGIGRPAWNVP